MPQFLAQRTCLGCRRKKPKKELVRIVLGKENKLICDFEQKRKGRGAYLCLAGKTKTKGKHLVKQTCLAQAIKKNAFQHAFKTQKIKSKEIFAAANSSRSGAR